MSDRDERYADVDTSHLEDVEDGCGCTEIWEHTSEREGEPDHAAEEADAEATDSDADAEPVDSESD